MSDEQTRPALHALLSDYIVADGDIERPTVGGVLHGLALRPDVDPRSRGQVQGTPEVVSGVVEWVRYDEANGVFEAAVDAGSFRFLTQFDGRGPGWSVGSSIRVEGVLMSVGPYEFEGFGLPDVRQDWLVISARQQEPGYDYQLEIQPL